MLMEVKSVTKRFGGLAALSDVSFNIEEGAIIGIIGPNGAGKTTLFNCICGLLDITDGDVVFCGESVKGLPPYKMADKGIARAFQIVKPFGNMTTLQNVMVGAFCKTDHYAEAEKLAMEALRKVGLESRANVMAKHLNLGQRKRLEIAKALATQPRLLLLDEVMAGLTPPEVKDMVEVIRDINRSGVTILLIEHIMKAVVSLCEKVIVLHHGEKIAEGTPEQVMNDPYVMEVYLGTKKEGASA